MFKRAYVNVACSLHGTTRGRHVAGGLCVGSSDNLHVERKSPLLGEGAEAYQGNPPRPPGMWTPAAKSLTHPGRQKARREGASMVENAATGYSLGEGAADSIVVDAMSPGQVKFHT